LDIIKMQEDDFMGIFKRKKAKEKQQKRPPRPPKPPKEQVKKAPEGKMDPNVPPEEQMAPPPPPPPRPPHTPTQSEVHEKTRLQIVRNEK
jgi:hypothetical protein